MLRLGCSELSITKIKMDVLIVFDRASMITPQFSLSERFENRDYGEAQAWPLFYHSDRKQSPGTASPLM